MLVDPLLDPPLPGPEDVEAAAKRISNGIVRTPMVRSEALSRRLSAEIWLKLENLQATGSFKDRGALNRLLTLSEPARAAGVIAMSAGNHAQAVAWHAKRLGIAATIVMPGFTPFAKVARTRGHGARVILLGDTLEASAREAHRIAADEGLTFVHPYDDDAVLAGQGTAALEMLQDEPGLDTLAIPVGGGGLIAGCALAASGSRQGTGTRPEVVGVEVAGWTACAQRLAGQPIETGGATLAEGIAVRDTGKRCFPIIEAHVAEVLVVPEAAVEAAILLLVEEAKVVTEGAGAAGIAALLAFPDRFRGRRVGIVLCGGNVDARVLANVLMRGMVRDGRLVRLHVDIADRPGSLADVAGRIAGAGGNILEVEHHRLFSAASAKAAELEMLIEARDAAHGQAILEALEAAAYGVRRLG